MLKLEKEKKRILVMDDDPGILDLLDRILSRAGYQISRATHGLEALVKAKTENPDLIILDIMVGGIDGMEVKSRLNEDTSTSGIPVIFLSGKAITTMDKIKGFNLGSDDYITKPFDLDELLARINRTLKRRKFYEEISVTDGLTGLHNIHYFKKQIKLFFDIAKRYKKVFSLAIIDLDNLKKINDTHGHAVGDFCLKKLSSIIEDVLRRTDVITRYGGDEFAIIMPESDKIQATKAMERIREEIEDKLFTVDSTGKKISFSVSIGIAAYNEALENETQLFELADVNMYKEKKTKKKNQKGGGITWYRRI